MEQVFERALRYFVRESLHLPGTTGVHLVSPADGESREFGILRSFDSESARDEFYSSSFYAKWQKEIAPMVIGEPVRRELHGLEAFFRGADTAAAYQPSQTGLSQCLSSCHISP